MRNLIDELESEKSHAKSMKAAAQMWMERAQQAELTLAIAVHAAGGEIIIHRDHLEDAYSLTLIREERPWDMALRLKTRVAQGIVTEGEDANAASVSEAN